MDWQAAATQLINLVLPERSFAPDFDFESEWPALLGEFSNAVAADARAECVRLRGELALRDEASAAEQRLRDLGATEHDINTLRGAR